MKLDDKFIFSLDRPLRSVKKKDIIIDLKAFAEFKKSKSLTAVSYTRWNNARFSVDSVRRIFGSWENAMKAIGLSHQKKHYYSDKEIIKIYIKIWRWREQAPSENDIKEYNKEFNITFSADTISRRWDKRVFKRLISQYVLKQITIDQVIEGKKKITRPRISPRLRATVLKKYNYRCTDCGKSPKVNKNIVLEINHIIPFSKGGETILNNLEVNCHGCNAGKSDVIY